MAFDWMDPKVPAGVRGRGPAARRAACEREVRERAELLRSLGRDEAFATSRCQRNLDWAFDVVGTPPLTANEVRDLVAAVYAR